MMLSETITPIAQGARVIEREFMAAPIHTPRGIRLKIENANRWDYFSEREATFLESLLQFADSFDLAGSDTHV